MRVLIIEDDLRLAELIRRLLATEHIDADMAHDGVMGAELALQDAHDVIVLDRMLPGKDGIEILRIMRQEGVATPTLMLTARSDLRDRVEGLDAGADDYLAKPFEFDELLARLRALLRRKDRPFIASSERLGPLAVDLMRGTVKMDNAIIPLTRQEFLLLEALIVHRGQIMTRDQLLQRVWGYDADPQGNVVELYIHYLRRKLETAAVGTGKLITTVRGLGYSIPE